MALLDAAATHANSTAQQYAEKRRDHNVGWSRWAMRACDKDPVAWYRAFQALLKSIDDARNGSDILAIQGAAADDHAQISEEVWKDAPESPWERQP